MFLLLAPILTKKGGGELDLNFTQIKGNITFTPNLPQPNFFEICAVVTETKEAGRKRWRVIYGLNAHSSYVALQLFYRVLALSTNSFHIPLSWARVFQFGTFNFRISFLTSSTQRVLGLPIGLLEMGFQEYIAFTILVLCILSM